MSKLEMVPWNPLSLVIKIMFYSRAGTKGYVANVGRVKDKEGTHLSGSNQGRPLASLAMLVSLLQVFCFQEEEAPHTGPLPT